MIYKEVYKTKITIFRHKMTLVKNEMKNGIE